MIRELREERCCKTCAIVDEWLQCVVYYLPVLDGWGEDSFGVPDPRMGIVQMAGAYVRWAVRGNRGKVPMGFA